MSAKFVWGTPDRLFAVGTIPIEDIEWIDACVFNAAPDLLAACEKALDIIQWMSGSSDFAPEGQAHQGWLKAQSELDTIRATITQARGDTSG